MNRSRTTLALAAAGFVLAAVPSIVFRALGWDTMLQIWHGVSIVGFLVGLVLLLRWAR